VNRGDDFKPLRLPHRYESTAPERVTGLSLVLFGFEILVIPQSLAQDRAF
jgi:hypothetical protein